MEEARSLLEDDIEEPPSIRSRGITRSWLWSSWQQDWSRYDTAHCVFRPRHMTPTELEEGRAWLYRRLFSLRSIWARRPRELAAVPPYLAMALLYKRSNWLWRHLVRLRLTHAVWAPLVEFTRRRHVRFRARLAAKAADVTRGGVLSRSG